MSESNKTLVREFYTQVWNAHNPAVTGDYYAVDFVDHNPSLPDQPAGAAGAQQVFSTFLAAFPNLQFTIDLQIAEDNLVSTRWTATATNNGSLMGMPPTGRTATVTGIDIFRIAGGKVVERWGNFDMAGLMRQLGAGQ